MRLFSEESSLVPQAKGQPPLALPWLNYKVAKKLLSKALSRLVLTQQGLVPQSEHTEPGNARNLEEVCSFFAMLEASLAEIDSAFRVHADRILRHHQLAKALSLIQKSSSGKTTKSTSTGCGLPRWQETKVLVTCHGLSLQAATQLANSALQVATWAELNAVAMNKIMKKFDKRLAVFCGSCSDFKQEQYHKHAFLQGPSLIELRCCCKMGAPVVCQPWLSTVATPRPLEEVPTSCPVCLGAFVEPLGLPCGHCLCRQCHTSMTSNTDKADAACPLCRGPCGDGPVPMQQLSELVHTLRPDEWAERKKDVVADEATKRHDREQKLKALPPNSRLMCMSMDILS